MKKIRILHFGSYWMGNNDIVYLMQRSLSRLPNVEVFPFDCRLYDRRSSPFVKREGNVNWLNDSVVRRLVDEYRPDLLVCNAGGLTPSANMHDILRARGIHRAGFALSDPDDFQTRSRRFAQYFSSFFTNAVLTLNEYAKIGVHAQLLPFAADPTFHRPLNTVKKYDVVIVGGMRADRARLVARLREESLNVGCFGQGWASERGGIKRKGPRLLASRFDRSFKRINALLMYFGLSKISVGPSSEVHGDAHVHAINSGTTYISFAKTGAGFTNVKVGLFEAAACGACILVDDFEEIARYFEPDKEILTFISEDDAVERAKKWSRDSKGARKIGAAARRRVIAEHTWEHRWKYVLDVIASRTEI